MEDALKEKITMGDVEDRFRGKADRAEVKEVEGKVRDI